MKSRWLRHLLMIAVGEAVEWGVHYAAKQVGIAAGKRLARHIEKPKRKPRRKAK